MEIELLFEERIVLDGNLVLVRALIDGEEAYVGRHDVKQETDLKGRFTRIRVDLAKREG